MHTATRTHGFTESVIRGMTRLANEHGAINLAQGFPNFPAPEVLKEAAARAIRDDVNQYAITWGAKRLRDALVAKYAEWYGLRVDPETEVTVTCGATEAMASALLAIVDPGDEVIVFEPFYENYGPDAILCGAKLDGMGERRITISGASKPFSVTGWRIGTIVAPAAATDAIRKVHDFLTVGAPAPLQEAVAIGLETLGPEYYRGLAADYRARRDLLCGALGAAGFRCTPPEGAYYVLADFSAISDLPDDAFARWLTCEAGVAPVPGSSFFSRGRVRRPLVRFAFCKTEEQLKEAGERLRRLGGRVR